MARAKVCYLANQFVLANVVTYLLIQILSYYSETIKGPLFPILRCWLNYHIVSIILIIMILYLMLKQNVYFRQIVIA
jgi:hypothetical protein